jgi:hypothetical protein
VRLCVHLAYYRREEAALRMGAIAVCYNFDVTRWKAETS